MWKSDSSLWPNYDLVVITTLTVEILQPITFFPLLKLIVTQGKIIFFLGYFYKKELNNYGYLQFTLLLSPFYSNSFMFVTI